MFLKRLSLVNFKNYEQAEFDFSSKINCIVGKNGIGKTNILDAIYYLSTCKSYFNNTDSLSINFNQSFFMINGCIENTDSIDDELVCSYKKNHKKIFKRNGKEYEKFSEHIGFIPVVMITPYDSMLITEGSEERRKLFDIVISMYDRQYLNNLINYNRILTQRNKFLKENSRSNNYDNSLYDVYDEQLAHFGTLIFEARKKFINDFLPYFIKTYQQIACNDEVIDLHYESQLSEADFLTLLKDNINKDKSLEYTSVGIHKDDYLFHIHGYPLKKVGSQGQQKTFLLSLKLAEFEYISQVHKNKPILMLDDIFDKIDLNRVENIIKIVSDAKFGQIFVTDTDYKRIDGIFNNFNLEHKIFDITNNDN